MSDVSRMVVRSRWVAGAICALLPSVAPIANAQPCEPAPVGEWQDGAGNDAHDVAVEGTLAVVADSVHGVRFLDVSDPANPTLLATQVLHTQAGGVALCYGVDIHGGLVYVAAGGLHVIDATDPSSPVLLGQVEPDFSARDFLLQVRVVGGHAFCLGQTLGLQMFDVSDPGDPVWIDTVPSDQGGSEWAGFRSLIEHDGVLFYGAEDEGLYAVDVTGPDPEVLFVGYDHATIGVQSLSHDRGYLYVSGRWTQVFDARDPTDITHLGWV